MISNLHSIEFRQSQQTILMNVTFALWLIVVIKKQKTRRRFSILIYNLVSNPHDKGLPNPVQNELSDKDGFN